MKKASNIKTKSKYIPPNPFILVDGSSYLFRAYHALPPLTTQQNEPTGAMYGVLNMLRKLLAEHKPTLMAVVFDSKEKNFRHELYENYKSNRVVMPEDLQQQIAPLQEIIQAMGLPLIVMPGFEADDIIATLANKAKQKGLFTLISTGDKDFAQIVDENTYLINTMSNDVFDRERVIEKFEVPPEAIVDLLSLMGDTVDNIPGVPKVGPKTAVKWLQTYKTLDNIIQHADEIPGKVGENLRDTIPKLPLYKKLVTIDTNITLAKTPQELALQKPNQALLKELFTRFEFKSWLRDLNLEMSSISSKSPTLTENSSEEAQEAKEKSAPLQSTKTFVVTKAISQTPKFETIFTEDALKTWVERLKKAPIFAFDLETNSQNDITAEIVGISFSDKPNEGAYIPIQHHYAGVPQQLPKEVVFNYLKPILESDQYKKVGHHIKFDAKVLLNYNIHLSSHTFDIMLQSYVLNSAGTKHDIETLALRYLEVQTTPYETIRGKGAKQISFDKVAIEEASIFVAKNAEIILRLHHHIYPKVNALPKLPYILETIEIPLISVLMRMERIGVLIDTDALQAQGEELSKRLLALETEAYQMGGMPFNLNSPKQLQEVLYTHLKLPVLEKTPTGQPSTAESVLEDLAEKYPLPKIILEYRSLSKLKSTYIDALPKQIDPITKRVHTSYQQAVTSTGRLSSTDPNLQNIPIRSLDGRKIRKAFIAAPGYKIVSADYSQIELRIMAHFSNDPGLIHAFSIDEDIHRSTASEFFQVPLKEVSFEERRQAKIINFGLLYGMSGFGLSKQLGVSKDVADKYVKRYFEVFPNVRMFIEGIKRQAIEHGYVETLFGRRLYLPEIQSRNMTIRRAQERAAINAPMQGTNADIIKLAMIKIDHLIETEKLNMRMLMQVHDELVFEIGEDCLEEAVKKLKDIMEHITTLAVPLRVGIGIGDNWDEAH